MIQDLAACGTVVRLWRTVDAEGPPIYGFWRSPDERTLRRVLDALLLARWLSVIVHALTAHVNDPRASHGAHEECC